MLVGGVIYYQIHDQPHVPPVHFVQQSFKVLHGAEIVPKWWKEAVFYQIYPRSFCDSNGDAQLFQVVQLSRDAR